MMNNSDSDAEVLLIPDTILQSERLYEAAIDTVIASAEHELLIFDPDFAKGDYQSLKRYETLKSFLSKDPNNKLILVTHNTDYLAGYCARLMDLLKIYSHVFSILITDEYARAAQDAIVLADKKHYLHRFHLDQARFKFNLNDAKNTQALRERFDQLLEASSNTVFSTTLGL
jgi:hypothetical protein